MYPTLFSWQGIGVHTWGLMIMLAFLAACLVTSVRAPRVGVDADRLVPLYLVATIAGLGGARLLHFAMAEPELFFEYPWSYFDPDEGGFAFYGGVVGGVLAGALYARIARLPVLKLADVIAPTIMLGLAVGRVGCFFAGCCHGRAVGLAENGVLLRLPGGSIVTTDGSPWVALEYVKGVGVGAIHGEPLFPTQPWESAGAFVLFGVLSLVWRRWRRFDGQVLAAMLLLYAGLRSFIEEFRGDEIRGLYALGPATLSTSQIVSIAMLLAAAAVAVIGFRRGLAPEAPVVDDRE